MSERLPYCRHTLGDAEISAVTEVLRSGWIARGPRGREFEAACAERLEARHAVACANGSVALEIALRGLGIGPGDEVIVPTLTWVASAMAVRLVGATPIFCDIDSRSLNATPATVEAAWTERTRAVIAVDMAGCPVDVTGLRALVDERGAVLIEDAAHAFGGSHPDGRPVGSSASGAAPTRPHAATFSFHPAKTITTAEGGLVTCDDDELAERMRSIRSGGITRSFDGAAGNYDYLATELGSNHHLTELSAALGLCQLRRLDGFLDERRRAFAELRSALAGLAAWVELPEPPPGSSHNLFIVQLRPGVERDRVLRKMQASGVMAHVHYPLLHRQPIFAQAGRPPLGLPTAEDYERRALTLPLFPGLTAGDIERIALTLTNALGAELPLNAEAV